ncbi:MAG: porin family protein [Chlorobiaceae bacterium]|nr:porin family protein [Chlorobiaceae bacterium]
MKKRHSLLAALLAAGTLSAPAFAAGHYVSGNVGINWMNDVTGSGSKAEMKTGTTFNGAVGCNYENYRMEAEAGYQDNYIKSYAGRNYDGNITVYSLMANGYYDFDAGSVKPFLMGGVGLAQVGFNNVKESGNVDVSSEHDTTLAYQLGAGLAIPVGRHLNVDARYRYFSTTNFTAAALGSPASTHVSSNGLLVGLRMNF